MASASLSRRLLIPFSVPGDRFLKIVVQQEPNCDVRSAHEQCIKQTDSLNICAREERSECAAKNICRREKEHKLNLGRAAQRVSRRFLKIVVQQEPNCDIRSAHEQ